MYENELEVAEEAARLAGKYLVDNVTTFDIKEYKENSLHNFATKQDLDAQVAIVSKIQEAFPHDGFITEEESVDINTSADRIWIIDPIDGTRNYINGFGFYAINIGLYEAGEMKLGLTYAPGYNDTLYTAIKGQGMLKNGEKLPADSSSQENISRQKQLKEVIVLCSFPYNRGLAKQSADRMLRILPNATDICRIGSAALEIAMVAEGIFGAHLEVNLKPWDICSGLLFLDEMGCKVSDFDGQKVDLFKKNAEGEYAINILSSINDTVHQELLELL